MSDLEDVDVGPDHPAWRGIRDDDWNGHTFSNWLLSCVGRRIVLRPSPDHAQDLVDQMVVTVARVTWVKVGVPGE